MCGIAGAYSLNLANEAREIVQLIISDQHSRGPDHNAIAFASGNKANVLLAHNRLSIVDLSSHANQPMWDVTGRYCVTYNGEIYNHIELHRELEALGHEFHTHSDTEVILNAFKEWGIEMLHRFNGPFAFGLFDKETGELLLCRDRFGVKPLYYTEYNQTLYFASTTTALAKRLRLAPNLNYVARGLKYWVYEDETDISPHQNLKQIPAGHYLKVKIQNAELKPELVRYYDLEERTAYAQQELQKLSASDLLCLGLEHLQRSVTIRLRSDVPVGITLSGGLDSSSVAALTAAQHPEVRGFSFGHPDIHHTEGPLVDRLSKHTKLKVDYIWPTAEEFTATLFKTLQVQGAPFAGISVVAQYLVYQRAREQGVKVLLGGQGGDEVFMGYRKFNWFWLQELLHQKKYLGATQFLMQLIPMFSAELGQFKKYWQQLGRYGSRDKNTSALNLSQVGQFSIGYQAGSGIKLRQSQDITRFSLPTLLRYEDRNSLGNSIESRLPFMDYQLVEYGLALPEAFKLRKGYGKWVVREWMHNKIPESIRAARYKRGFDVGIEQLITSGLGQAMRNVLQENKAATQSFLLPGISIDSAFSDSQFINRQATFAEAVSLIWLKDHI